MKILRLIVLIILVAAGLWRFRELDRDPPVISASAGEWMDPGTYLYNARNFLRSHDWAPVNRHGLSVAPGFVLLATVWGSVFGSGYAGFVSRSVICGFIAAAATAYIAWRAGRISPLVTLFPFAISYTYFCFQRVPKGDMETLAVSSLAAAFLVGLENNRRASLLAFAGGVLAGLAPFMKLFGILFSLACGAAWLIRPLILNDSWDKPWRKATWWFVLGLASTVLLWLGWAFWLKDLGLGKLTDYAGAVTETVTGSGVTFGVARFIQSNLSYRQPVEALLVALAVGRLLFFRRWSWPVLFCAVWLMTGVAAVAFMPYAPTRYRLLFIPPAIVLASLYWSDLAAGRAATLSLGKSIVVYGLGAWATFQSVAYFCENHPGWSLPYGGLSWQVFCVLLLTCSLWLIFERAGQRTLSVVLAALMIVLAIPQWWYGENATGYALKTLAADAERAYPHAVLFGGWGQEVALWSNLSTPSHLAPIPPNGIVIEEAHLFDTFHLSEEWAEVRRVPLRAFGQTIVIATHR